MDFILSLIPGGGLTAIIAAVVATLGAIAVAFRRGAAAGRDKQKAKEADLRAKNLDHIRAAADARARGDSLSDPRNRDKRGS